MENMTCAPQTADTQDDHAEEDVVHLPLGLLGLEQLKDFIIVGHPGERPFLWLQSQDESSTALLVLPPAEAVADYKPDISKEDTAFLGLKRPQNALVLNIVTLHRDGKATINLKGPIVINARTRVGKQVVPVNAGDYSVQHPLPTAA